jgi:hypothetical protein
VDIQDLAVNLDSVEHQDGLAPVVSAEQAHLAIQVGQVLPVSVDGQVLPVSVDGRVLPVSVDGPEQVALLEPVAIQDSVAHQVSLDGLEQVASADGQVLPVSVDGVAHQDGQEQVA